jgi:class 3 adenylate cyclase
MNCSACGVGNRDQALYCSHCGAALGRACAGCGTLLPAAARFCDACGAHVTSAQRRPERGDAERRQVTVLFADLVGSTPLAESVEPEELRDLILGYQRICGEAIHRLGGYLAHYYGDGVVAYFGYPVAQEYDARARGALRPRDRGQMRKSHQVRKLAARIGIHTGMVVVGEMGALDRPELVAMGSAPNIAARLQTLAQPNTVVISEVTQRLTRGFFDCVDLARRR